MWNPFRCKHRRISRVFTPRTTPGSKPQGSYVQCFDCHRNIVYDLSTMTTLGPVETSDPPVTWERHAERTNNGTGEEIQAS